MTAMWLLGLSKRFFTFFCVSWGVLKENVIHGAGLGQTRPINHIFFQHSPGNDKECEKPPGHIPALTFFALFVQFDFLNFDFC